MMSRLYNWSRAVYDARRSNRRDRAAIGHFHSTVLAFGRLQSRIHNGPRRDPGDQRAWDYITLFYALASSRMRIADRLCTIVERHTLSAANQAPLHARLNFEQLAHQVYALTLAADIELAYVNESSDSWKTAQHLFVSVPAHTLSQRDTELNEYMEALFRIIKGILSDLQTQIQTNESESTHNDMGNATGLLSEAQHIIEAVGSPADWSSLFAGAPAPFQTEQSPTIEALLQELLRLIEAAGAEFAAPGITQTALWGEIFGDPRRQAYSR